MGAGVETCEFPVIALALSVEGELSTCEECRGDWILHWSWLGVESWKLELISLPYSVPFTYRQFFLILISLHMVPASMSFHLSFNPLYTIVPEVIPPLNHDNRAFWHAVYKPRFFRASKFSA